MYLYGQLLGSLANPVLQLLHSVFMMRSTTEFFILGRAKHLILRFKEILYHIVHISITEDSPRLMCPGSIKKGEYAQIIWWYQNHQNIFMNILVKQLHYVQFR